MNNEKLKADIEELLKSEDSFAISQFKDLLRLIESVDGIYSHIVELEKLHMIMRSGLSDYYKEYHKRTEEATILCAHLCENTRSNHYGSNKRFDIYDAMEICNMKRREFKKIYN